LSYSKLHIDGKSRVALIWDRTDFGYTIESTKAAWRELKNTKAEIAGAFDATILEMKTTP
jgi:hypothetical protein